MHERDAKIERIVKAMVDAAAGAGCSLQNMRLPRVMAAAALDEIEPVTRWEIGGGFRVQKDGPEWWVYDAAGRVAGRVDELAVQAIIALTKDRA